MLTLLRDDLPTEVKQLPQPPEVLHVAGADLSELMRRPRLAVIGSRKVTPYGSKVTEELVKELAAYGMVIVSGLALGVDSIAHKACMDARGQTIAVLPAGLDRIYPATHRGLAKDIIQSGGTLVTEYGEGTEPYPSNFLARNRIIAALSEAVLVIEAAERSGTLNTVNHALELGKTVFAVPGNIDSLMSVGCNNLIKAGAVPVTSVEDVLDAMGWSRDLQLQL